MKLTTPLALAASASLSLAQTLPAAFECGVLNGVYCAGDSLGTDVIVRCQGLQPQIGSCSDNLVGYPPLGVNPALCWASPTEPGVAACEKNCIVYGASGNVDGDFTLSDCTPSFTATTTPSTSTLVITQSHEATTVETLTFSTSTPHSTETSTSFSVSIPILTVNTTSTAATTPPTNSTTIATSTFTPTTSVPTGGHTGNSTQLPPTQSASYDDPPGPATKTPVGPTTTHGDPSDPTFVPSGAAANSAGLGLVLLGIVMALAV